jgi:hypothetical protein
MAIPQNAQIALLAATLYTSMCRLPQDLVAGTKLVADDCSYTTQKKQNERELSVSQGREECSYRTGSERVAY